MNTYITYSGLGFEFDVDDVDTENLENLIKKLPKDKILKDFDESDFDISDKNKVVDTIVLCLNELNGVESFMSVEDDDGYIFILFRDKSPWEYTEKEKVLTADDVRGFFKNTLDSIIWGLDILQVYIANLS